MIISCPACQTQFNADPSHVGPDGRKVRCAKCAHVWRVGADGMPAPEEPRLPPEVEAAPVVVPEPPLQAEEPQSGEIVEPPADESEVAPAVEEFSALAPEMNEHEDTVEAVTESAEGEETAESPEDIEPLAAPESDAPEAALENDEADDTPAEESGKPVLLAGDGKRAGGEDANGGKKAALANVKAMQKKRRGKRQKGGKVFQRFVLLICIVILLLFATRQYMQSYTPGTTPIPGPGVGDVEAPGKPAGATGESGSAQ